MPLRVAFICEGFTTTAGQMSGWAFERGNDRAPL